MGKLAQLRSNGSFAPSIPSSGITYEMVENWGWGRRSDSGEMVTPHTALASQAVWRCVTMISAQVASAPLIPYLITDKGKQVAFDHSLYNVIRNQPNPEQNAIAFRTAGQMALLLWGNAYIELQRNQMNQVVAMWLRHPSKTHPFRDKAGVLKYETTDNWGNSTRVIDAEDMIHILGDTLDGSVGLSPVEFQRQTVGLSLALDKFSARFFANFATPSLVITSDQEWAPEDKTKLRQDWQQLHSQGNQHNVAVLDGGLKVQPISINPDQAQFLQSKQMIIREVASIFGVPPNMVGDVEKSTRANVEQDTINLTNFCLRPWFKRWEAALAGKLFSSVGRSAGKYAVHFDARELLRPDAASRAQFYQTGLQNGILSVNEARELEQLNPIGPVGDAHLCQLNMQTLEMVEAQAAQQSGPDSLLMNEEEENSFVNKMSVNYRRIYKDAVSRMISRSKRDLNAARATFTPALETLVMSLRQMNNIPSTEIAPNDESARSIAKILEGIESRAASWSADNIDAVTKDELNRALKSLIYASFREQANLKAQAHIDALAQKDDE